MDGILVINKPPGITSHDVVDVIRKKFNIRRVGHAGTLDPMATGVLVVLIGNFTRISSTFIEDDKEYIATLCLGKSTDTQDATGRVVEEKEVGSLDIETIKKTFDRFIGKIDQVPPMMSAKKYKGVRLYKLGRRGKRIERKPCRIKIYKIQLMDFNLPEIKFWLRCSKGTYVRTLCQDIGKVLGYPAHMSALTRTRSGRFSLERARSLDEVSKEDLLSI